MLVMRPIWQDLADYEVPRKADIDRSNFWAPRKQTDKMLDETAPQAATELAAEMQGNLTSAASKWFGLMMSDKAFRDEPEWQEWLETSASAIYDAYQNSNFNEEMQEGYLDLVVFGIMALLMEEIDESAAKFSGFRFEALALGSFAIDENRDGLVDVLHRKFRLSARAMAKRWSMDDWEGANESALMAARNSYSEILQNDPFRQIDICHAVYPRPEGPSDYGGRRRRQKNKEYASCYFLEAEKILIHEGGFDDFPGLVPRWSKQPGELYGRGPGLLALPSTKSLNRAIEMDFKSWAKDLDPPMSVKDRGVIGRVRTSAAAVNIVRVDDAIKPTFDRRTSNYQPTQIRVERLERKIQKCFFVDQFQLPGGGPSPGSQNTYMTATETEKRYEIMQQLLGPTLGRLKYELHKPCVERSFRVMGARGAIPPVPQGLVEAYRGSKQRPLYSVVYEGPLERAARASTLQSINRAWSVSAAVFQAQPEAIDVIDGDNLIREIFTASGTPFGVLKDKRAVKMKRDERAAAMKAEAERVRMNELAQAAGQAAPMAKALQAAPGQNGDQAPPGQ
jgi:hypothetical protein